MEWGVKGVCGREALRKLRGDSRNGDSLAFPSFLYVLVMLRMSCKAVTSKQMQFFIGIPHENPDKMCREVVR